MNHVSEAEWVAYLADEIPEALKIEYENHLYSCDKCLSAYMEAMEREETSLDIEGFDIAGPVMDSISRLKGGSDEEPRPHRKEKSLRTITLPDCGWIYDFINGRRSISIIDRIRGFCGIKQC
jgi:hypothetical protein